MERSTYVTNKHENHDERWTCHKSPSVSICFACAIETLEVNGGLRVLKKRILSDLLETFLTNKCLVRNLCYEENVLIHTVEVVISHLPTGDNCLDHLLFAVLGSLVSITTSQEPLYLILKEVINKIKGGNEELALKLLGRILKDRPSTTDILLNREAWIVEKIINTTAQIDIAMAPNYWFVLAKMCLSENALRCITGQTKIVLIESCINTLIQSSSTELQLNVLAVLKLLLTNKEHATNFIQFESSRPFCDKSVVDALKKMILSTVLDVQTIALQCIYFICSSCLLENEMDLIEKFIRRGTCEFLFELVTSENDNLRTAVLSCLSLLASSPTFYSLGHFVYGIDSLTSSLRHSITSGRKNSVRAALQTFLISFQTINSHQIQVNLIPTQIIVCLELFTMVLKFNDHAMDLQVAETIGGMFITRFPFNYEILDQATKLLRKMANVLLKLYKKKADHGDGITARTKILHHILSSFCKTVKEIQSSLSLADQGQEVQSNERLATTTSQQNGELCSSTILRSLYETLDAFILPSFFIHYNENRDSKIILILLTTLKTVTNFKTTFLRSFCQKLGKSSFLRILVDIRSRPYYTASSRNDVSDLTSDLIVKICLSLEKTKVEELELLLSESLHSIMITPREWSMFFSETSLRTCHFVEDHVLKYCAPCLAVFYYSAVGGDFLITDSSLMMHFADFILFEGTIEALSTISKRHLLYLWVTGSHNCMLDLAESINKELARRLLGFSDICNVYTHSYDILRWTFRDSIPYLIKVSFLKEFFVFSALNQQEILDLKCDEKIESTSPLSVFKLENFRFIMEDSQFCKMLFDITVQEHTNIRTLCKEMLQACLSEVSLRQKAVEELTSYAYKSIIFNSSQLSLYSLLRIIDILLVCLVIPGFEMVDSDLKLLCQMLSIYSNYQSLDIRLGVLNYVSIIVEKSLTTSNMQPIVLITANNVFMEQLTSSLPNWKLEYNRLKVDSLYEKNVSATIILIANLGYACRTHSKVDACNFSLPVCKEECLELLNCQECDLLQISLLVFWQRFLVANGQPSGIFQFVFSDGAVTEVLQQDLLTLQITVQNMLFSQNRNLLDAATALYRALVESKVTHPLLLHQPWNNTVFSFLLESLLVDEVLNPTRAVRVLLSYHQYDFMPQLSAFVIEKFASKLNLKEEGYTRKDADCVAFIDLLVEKLHCKITEISLKKFRTYLNKVYQCLQNSTNENIPKKSSQLLFIRGVIIPSISTDSESVKETISKCTSVLESVTELLDNSSESE